MKKTLTQIIASVVVLIIGTFVGIIVERYRTEAQGKMRFLDVDIRKGKSILSRPTIPGKNVEIMLEGKPIGSLSEVVVSIHNFTDKDFSDVPVYIELIPQGGSTLDIVGQQAVGGNDLPEAVEAIPDVRPSNIKGALRYGYKIKNVNRSEELLGASFRVKFLLIGQEVPDLKVATDKVGLKLQDFSYQHLIKDSFRQIFAIVIIIISIVGYILFVLIFLRSARRSQSKRDLKLQENLLAVLQDTTTQAKLGITPEKTGELATYFVRFLQKFRYEKTPRILRFLSAFPQPDKDPLRENSGTVQQSHQD